MNVTNNKDSCLKKVHLHETDRLKIKISNNEEFEIFISSENKIYKPLGFILSNLNNKKFKGRDSKKNVFEVLKIILSILNTTSIENKKTKGKKLLDDYKNILKNNKIVRLMQLGEYKFIIPDKLEIVISVTAENEATIKINKISNKKQKGGKRLLFKLIRNKDKYVQEKNEKFNLYKLI